MNNMMPPEAPKFNFKLEWQDIKIRSKEVIFFLPSYLKNPLEGIKHLPHWDWWTIILLEVLLGAACGFLSGVVSHHILAIIGGLLLSPIMNVVITGIIAGVMYYACLFLLQTELDFKRVFIVVTFSKIPAQLLSILIPLARPITLVCIIITALLLIVGFVENFLLDKRKITKIVGTLAGILILFWLYSMIVDATSAHIKIQDYTPESLDQINKELEK